MFYTLIYTQRICNSMSLASQLLHDIFKNFVVRHDKCDEKRKLYRTFNVVVSGLVEETNLCGELHPKKNLLCVCYRI